MPTARQKKVLFCLPNWDKVAIIERMCGRFSLTEIDVGVLMETFALPDVPPDLAPRYNIAPTQPVATVVRDPVSGQNQLTIMRWGLIPAWANDRSWASRMINARGETVAEKPAFREALSKRRCLIVANGFYEWQKQPTGPKLPMYITLRDHALFGFAGLWDRWTDPDTGERLTTCTIITTAPNALMAPIHDRMPVILPRNVQDRWLDPTLTQGALLTPLLAPFPAEDMIAWPVSRRVNTVSNDDPALIERAS